jgi:hypothetical protein
MKQMFPFGFDDHLLFYLVVYVVTLVVHVFLMAYVLAGSLWLAWATLFQGTEFPPRTKQPMARILREWMPFALSGAITAGVAPLLFVQILYAKQFYTANLLLGWRWMVVIPVLVLAFYLLYVIKSQVISRWAFPVRLALSISVAACFLFVAFCWTANHLLSLDATQWPAAFESGTAVNSPLAMSLRLATWVTGTFPVMSLLAAWQLRGMRSRTEGWVDAGEPVDWNMQFHREHRRLIKVSLAGLIASTVCASSYFATLPENIRSHIVGAAGFPWLLILIGSAAIVAIVLIRQWQKTCFCRCWLISLTVAMSVVLVAAASLREIIRLAQADLTSVARSTAAAWKIGGFGLFLLFTVVNAGLMTFCIYLVKRGAKTTADR